MPAPPSSSGSAGIATPEKPISPKTADDINDMFKELDVEPEKKTPKEKEDKETKTSIPDEDDREEEKDDDLELIEPEEEEEKLDLKEDDELNIDAPPRKKEILKEYPELFKKFPFLEKMLYRDRQYSELFGSFDDAREIAEKSEAFNQFENQLLAGNTEQILREVKETDDKAFKTIVDDYLVTLHKVDKDAYLHVTGNLNKRLIAEMIQEANDSNNEDLKQAALLVNQFVFGTSKYTPPSRLIEKKDSSEQDEIVKERQSFLKERFETARDDLQSQVDNTLRATISDYIDPKGKMTSYVKKNAIADAMRILSDAVADDPSVSKNLNNLWRAASESKFADKNALGKIKSFYLSKAKGNLKNAILKARAEALKDLAPQHNQRETDDEEVETETNSRRQPRNIPAGRPRQERGKTDGPRKGESVTDFFMRD
jgi:hypothetical protein